MSVVYRYECVHIDHRELLLWKRICQAHSRCWTRSFSSVFSLTPNVIEDEDNLFHFIAQVEALFEHPEQFQSEYQKLKESAGIHLSEEGQKLLDIQIRLALIGQRGREQMAERIRLIYAKYKTQ